MAGYLFAFLGSLFVYGVAEEQVTYTGVRLDYLFGLNCGSGMQTLLFKNRESGNR